MIWDWDRRECLSYEEACQTLFKRDCERDGSRWVEEECWCDWGNRGRMMTMLKFNHLMKTPKVMQEAAAATDPTDGSVDTAVEITLDLVRDREI